MIVAFIAVVLVFQSKTFFQQTRKSLTGIAKGKNSNALNYHKMRFYLLYKANKVFVFFLFVLMASIEKDEKKVSL